ncbi:MAG: alpha/beta hydrolase [Dehalococcoidia bacterium]|nr:alpha/beta hydrolase [Dehalococcoidia bacterium]
MILETHEYLAVSAAAPILLVHATGLHGRVFARLIEALPGDRSVLAPDLRGHGRSRWPEGEAFPERLPWDVFADDLVETVLSLGLERVVIAGHSMGAHSAVLAAAELESMAPEAVVGLVLFDPTIGPRGGRDESDVPSASEQPVMRRRNSWASAEEMFESFRGRATFANWDDAVLRDYCEGGLMPSMAGESLELACPPAVEAAVYAARGDQRVQARLDAAIESIAAPVWVVRARDRVGGDPPGLGPSATAPELASRFEQGWDRQKAGTGHFFPLEEPERAAAVLAECLERIESA